MTKPNGRKAPATRGVKSTESNGKSASIKHGRTNVNKRSPVIKKEPEDKEAEASGSESDVPIRERQGATSNGKRVTRSNGQTKEVNIKKEEPSNPEDQPTRRKTKKKIIASESEEESESDVPISKRFNKDTKSSANSLPSKGKQSKDSSSSSSKQTVKKEEPVVDGKKAKRKRTESDSEGDDSNKTTQKKTIKTESTKVDKDVEMKDAELESESVKKLSKANGKKPTVKEEDSESDVPLGKRGNKGKKSATPGKRTTRATTANDHVKQENKTQKTNNTKAKRKRNDSDSEFDDKKTSSKSTAKNVVKKANPQRKKKKEDPEEKEKGVSEKKKGKQKAAKVESDEEEDEEYRWWEVEHAKGDGTVKWNTLEHNGVYFPPEYVPHNVKMKYDGKAVHLEPEAEEVATFYAAALNTEHVENSTFNENFFRDFKTILAKSNKNPSIEDFDKCDFTPILEHLEREKEKRKTMSKEEKQKIKEEKLQLEEKYGFCYLDGRKQKVGNFRIEPPSLFRGRGKHPKTGSLKLRVQPEQVTINIGKEAKVPEPPAGHSWNKVIHDNTVTWLATWKENVNDNIKYVFLAANSTLKGQSDFKKFEKARELKDIVGKIREDYTRDMKSKTTATRQRATAMYFIDRLALRAGNEKKEGEEADTVGCCSLRFEHIRSEYPNIVHFDFLGKDSIRYQNTVTVNPQVYKNLKLFRKNSESDKDQLFDRVNTQELNKHLSSYMEGLTAKVFRTYNASYTFQEQLKNTPDNGTVNEKILAYNRANREVAILCNHQRTVSKTFDNQMNRIEDKIRALKYQRMRLKKTLLTLDPKLKKKRPELDEPESDLGEDWCEEYEKHLEEKEKERLRKKFEKDNEKRKEEGKKPLPGSELEEQIKEAEDKSRQSAKERKTGKIDVKKSQTIEKVDNQIEKINERIKATNLTKVEKEENKTTALGTSKINYIDPRISAAWCYKYNVPIDKIFNKSLRDKFKWAMEVDKDWEF
uniref:DNA topoisomerase I n=1 Tax=Anthurium amnicola TaxID=1678845 RepID=A0A1D1Y8P7_9ARAE